MLCWLWFSTTYKIFCIYLGDIFYCYVRNFYVFTKINRINHICQVKLRHWHQIKLKPKPCLLILQDLILQSRDKAIEIIISKTLINFNILLFFNIMLPPLNALLNCCSGAFLFLLFL